MAKQAKDYSQAKYDMIDHYDRNYPDSSKEVRNAYIQGLIDMTEHLNGNLKPNGKWSNR